MASFFQDVRYAVRQLRQSPGFAFVAILTLALGTGGTTAMFSLFDALVLRSLPVERPDRLVAVSATSPTGQSRALPLGVVDQLARQEIFSEVSGYLGSGALTTETEGIPATSVVDFVSGDYFATLGIEPQLGRTIEPADVPPGAPSAPVAVISHGFWQRYYGGSPDALGKVLRLEGGSVTIVGIAPREYFGLNVGISTDVTVPSAAMARVPGRPPQHVTISHAIGRLRDGVSIGEARARIEALWPGMLEPALPSDLAPAQRDAMLASRPTVATAASGFSFLRDRFTAPLQVLIGLTGLLLLITCVNLASLVIARCAGRDLEMGARLALGASARRLARQLLTENLLLATMGTAAGLPLAAWAAPRLAQVMGSTFLVPIVLDVAPDARVWGLAAALALATGAMVGLAPAWLTGRTDPQMLLRQARTATRGAARWSRGFLVCQIALSVALLVGTGVLVQTLGNLQRVQPGFDADRVLLARLSPLPNGYEGLAFAPYHRELVGRLSALPGVESAALTYWLPFTGAGSRPTFAVGPSSDTSRHDDAVATLEVVSAGHFETVGIPLLDGRAFTWEDDEAAPRVAIVTAELARRLFPAGRAVGRRIRVGDDPARRNLEVIGVCRDVRLDDLRSPPSLGVFVPTHQEPKLAGWQVAEIRAAGDPAALTSAVRRTVEAVGHEYVLRANTMSEHVRQSLLRERVVAALASFFGGLAALLVSIGLYGLLAHTVRRRTREIGVRLALGAAPGRLRRMVVWQALTLTLGGLALGLPCSVVLSRLVEGHLFDVTTRDPITLAAVGLVLVGIALGASYLPARRVCRIDPMESLRSE